MATAERRTVKVDRDEVFLEATKSVCPVCKTVIDAEVNVRDSQVILRKRCPEHGLFEALVYSDAELYLAQQRFNKPGTIPLEYQTEVVDGCPLDCGWLLILGRRHLEHVLHRYLTHYNAERPHRALALRLPADRDKRNRPRPTTSKIERHDFLGGLIHEYRAAA